MNLTSAAFSEGESIPKIHTGEGEDQSPHLQWTDPPQNSKSLALICEDPDAPMGVWVHWVIYNIPPTVRSLKQNFPKDPQLPDGTRQGRTDSGLAGYGGPYPLGGVHRYFFKLYALDAMFEVPGKGTKYELVQAMRGHVLAEAQLMGVYKREEEG